MICNFPKVSLRWNYYYTYTPYYWTQNWPTIMFLDLLPFKCSLRGFVGTQAFNIVIDNTPYYWKSESKMPLHTLIIKPVGLKFWRFALQVFVNIDVMFLCLMFPKLYKELSKALQRANHIAETRRRENGEQQFSSRWVSSIPLH